MNSKYLGILVILVAVGIAVWYFGNPKDSGPSESSKFNGSSNQQAPTSPNSDDSSSEDDTPATVEEVPNALVGELLASDDKKKGNLRIRLADSGRIIYLNTSRDFTALIGKQVQASIEGSIDDFRLLDIKEKN
jgi:hypothetical protein